MSTSRALLAVGLAILLACRQDAGSPGSVTGVPSEAAGIAPPNLAKAPSAPTSIAGTNFQIKTQVDNNFCLESANGTGPARDVTLQQCSSSTFQRWALPKFANQTNIIVDDQGMCLDGRSNNAASNFARLVEECGSGDGFRFTYLGTGLVQSVKDSKCLQIAGAAARTPLTLAACDASKDIQRWLITH